MRGHIARSLCAALLTAAANTSLAQPGNEWVRTYQPPDDGSGAFYDVTWVGNHEERGFAACGWAHFGGVDRFGWNYIALWFALTDEDGGLRRQRDFTDDNLPGFRGNGLSIISSDDGGFLIGGKAGFLDTTRRLSYDKFLI